MPRPDCKSIRRWFLEGAALCHARPVGQRIDELLAQRGLNQTSAAQRVGCNPSTISRMVRGEFTYDQLVALTTALAAPFGELFHLPFPERCALVVAGYAHATAEARRAMQKDNNYPELDPRQAITADRLRWMLAVVGEGWGQAGGPGGHQTVIARLTEQLGPPPRPLGEWTQEIGQLLATWGTALLACVSEVPATGWREVGR